MVEYRLVGNKMVPLTEEDLKQREIDAIDYRNKKEAKSQYILQRKKKLEQLKAKMSLTDEDLDLIKNGV